MSQNDEEAVLKSARILYKSGYSDEAKAVLAKLNTEQARTILAKMGGAGKTQSKKSSALLWPGLIAGYVVIAILAFALGWILSPKTQETMLLESINQELQESNPDGTATMQSRQATVEAIQATSESAATQIILTQTAMVQEATEYSQTATVAVQAATATAEAQGQ